MPPSAEGARQFQTATEIAPNLLAAWELLYVCQVAMARRDEAAKSAARIAALGGKLPKVGPEPAPIETLDQRARALLAEGKLGEAAPLLLEMQKLKPDDLYLLERIVEPLAGAGLHETAVALAQTAAQRFFSNAAAHRALGSALLKASRFEEAARAFEQAVKLAPDSADNWLGLGLSAGLRRRWDEAISAQTRAVRLAPDEVRVWNALVESYRTQGELLSAEAKMKELLAEFPQAAPGWFCLGALQCQGGMRQIGMRALKKAVELKPDFPDGWNVMGLVLMKSENTEERAGALALFERSVKLDPGHPESWNNLGWAHFLDGKLDLAIDGFQTALRTNPRYVPALANLTRAYLKKGATAQARETYERLDAIDPKRAAELRAELRL